MIELTVTQSIAAPSAHVWSILSDIERWTEWTPTITRIERLDRGDIEIGSRFRIAQPKLRPTLWTISEWKPGERFTWTSRAPGFRAVAEHALSAGTNGCSVRLAVRFEGVFARLAARLYGRLTLQYMQLEADGLRTRSEATRADGTTAR